MHRQIWRTAAGKKRTPGTKVKKKRISRDELHPLSRWTRVPVSQLDSWNVASLFFPEDPVNKRLYTIMHPAHKPGRNPQRRNRDETAKRLLDRRHRMREGLVIKYCRLYNEVRLPRTTIDFINYAKYRGLLWLQVALKARRGSAAGKTMAG